MSAYTDFKNTVLALTNRGSAIFTASSPTDLVLVAMNDVRRMAQRKYAFNLLRGPAFVQLSLAGKSILSDLTVDPTGAGASVVAKQVEACYEYGTATVTGVGTKYYRTARIPTYRHTQFQTQGEIPWSGSVFGSQSTVTDPLKMAAQFMYQQGTTLFHSTMTVPTWFWVDVVQWLPDHDGGAGTDVFLTYFQDWMRYAVLLYLNQFLKDSERFQIDEGFMQELWSTVCEYDAQQAAATGAINLD